MNKLSKPKAFEASESLKTLDGIEVANLLRSGIKNQQVFLVGHNQKWHEIELETIRIDDSIFLENSYLPGVVHYIERNNITLADMGIVEEVQNQSYDLEHDDFMGLSKMFPAYDYIQISKLHDYEKRNGLPNGVYHKNQTLKMLTDRKLSISDYIVELEEMKHGITNTPATYEEVVNTDKPQQEIKVETLPTPEQQTTPADSVSLQIFEKLTPEKITELQGLRITQEEIVKSNPVVVITNKTTYAQAKKTAAILLSASTAIDGSKGVEATATKYLNTFKTMLKTALLPIAKLTREPYDKQKKLIEDWDNRLILQAQNRVKELFAVPFAFNPDQDSYSIGSLIVMQKDIEDLSDVDWSKNIEQGKAIQVAMDALKNQQSTEIELLKKQIEAQQEQIRAFMALHNPAPSPQEAVHKMITEGTLVTETPFEVKTHNTQEFTIQTGAHNSESPFYPVNSAPVEQTEEKHYSLPHPDNKLLNELDLAHMSVLEEKQYIECREYYAQALQDAADAINDILVNPDKNIQKSVAITELIKTWKL